MRERIANRGLCRIVAVDPAFKPALCLVVTNLTEKFPVFDPLVAGVAEVAKQKKMPVHLTLKRSPAKHWYVTHISMIDFTKPEHRCVMCESIAVKVDVGVGAPYFSCPACHHRMFLSTVRVKS